MSAPALVTIAAAVVVILVLAVFLLAVMRVLVGVNRTLKTVIGAIETVSSKTEPVDSLVRSIDGNLASARDTLNGLLQSKVGADGAAELVASVDPLAQARPQRRTPAAFPSDEVPAPAATPQPAGHDHDSEPARPVPRRTASSIRLREDG